MLPALLALALYAEPPRRPAEVEAVLDTARGATAEIAADVLLRLAASKAVRDPAWKRKLIEEAFTVAPQAQWGWQAQYTGALALGFGSRNELHRAYNLGLDTLSIRCRAVRNMLPLDRRRAARLFEQIAFPLLPAPSCDDPMVPHVWIYYQTMALVAPKVEVAEAAARTATSSVQVPPLLSVIRDCHWNEEERARLLAALAGALVHIGPDDPAYSAAFEFGFERTLRALPSEAFRRAWRDYLLRQERGPRCAWTVRADGSLREYLGVNPVRIFNDELRTGALDSITPDQVKREISKVQAKREELFPPGAPEQLWNAVEHLVFGPQQNALSMAARQTADWQDEARAFLARLEEWTPEEPAGLLAFQQKAKLYDQLLDRLPAGAVGEAAARSYIAYLSSHPVRQTAPAVWLLALDRLLELTRPLTEEATRRLKEDDYPEGWNGVPTGNGPAILREVAQSRDPIIAMYAALERLDPRPNRFGSD